jgi:hypothetical protein
MGEYYDQLPDMIKDHVREITKSSGLPQDEESVEKIARGWIEKRQVFEDFTRQFQMEEVDSFERDDERGAIALTYSGSLVKIGPEVDGERKVQYTSIGLREDVPDVADKEGSRLSGDVTLDASIEFEIGPVKHTSPILKIAVTTGQQSIEEQEEAITEATKLISNGFAEVNRTIIAE